ncbi:hypothetical protein [Gemmiger formicilis]|uniref:hypothetical protein n=1 Tax=Gemmiger formicilis TaxID=745368 RepID=UPI003522F597
MPAFADTSVPPTSAPQTNVTQSSTDQKAETTVQFKIDPAYTVTIPGTVELKQKTDADTKKITYEKDFNITAADVRLNEGKTLRISLASDYKLASGATTLDYTVTAKQGTADAKAVNSKDRCAPTLKQRLANKRLPCILPPAIPRMPVITAIR